MRSRKKYSACLQTRHTSKCQDPGKLEGNTVFTYLDAFSRPEHFAAFLPEYANLDELKAHYTERRTWRRQSQTFPERTSFRQSWRRSENRRKELMKDIPYVYEVLKKGSEKAESVAAATLARVKNAMRINYFEDEELIRTQAEQMK